MGITRIWKGTVMMLKINRNKMLARGKAKLGETVTGQRAEENRRNSLDSRDEQAVYVPALDPRILEGELILTKALKLVWYPVHGNGEYLALSLKTGTDHQVDREEEKQ